VTPLQRSAPVIQLRVALTTSDYARLVQFYCTGLGLEPAQVWTNNDDRGLMLEMGQASLEVFDAGYAQYIDELEAGRRLSGRFDLPCRCPICRRRWRGCWPTAQYWSILR
jgi:lactoylglutathione lyase